MNLGMETETVEHKKSTGEMREGMESIASILNKHGHGTLYFGVRNDGEVIGQEVSEKTLRDVSQAVGNRIEPRIYPQIERLETEDGRAYIRVEFSGDERPYACDGRYRIRSADEDNPMSTAALESMMLERAATRDPWDGRSSGLGIDAVDEDVLRKYVSRGVRVGRIPFEYTDARDVLSRLGLLCPDGTLTNAAMVCFTDRQQVGIRMGILADSRRTQILDNQQLSGSLFGLASAAEYYIVNNIRRAFVIDGSSIHRTEVPEIPMAAVREALLNALCHRMYETNAAVQVDIYWDKVDIYSPGPFPVGVSPEAYLFGGSAASNPRNVRIAQTLYRSGDIESYGTGLQRIKRACDEQGTPVEFFERGRSVHVVFTRQEALDDIRRLGPFAVKSGNEKSPANSEVGRKATDISPTSSEAVPKSSEEFRSGSEEATRLDGGETAAAEFLASHGPSRTSEVAKALGMSSRGALKVLQRLVNKDVAEVSGKTSSRTYRLREGR